MTEATKEIKEILDKLKLLCYDDYCLEFSVDYIERKEEKALLDYITNLQQDIANYVKITLHDRKEIDRLQQENEKLKEDNLLIKSANKLVSDNLHNYKSRCEKATEELTYMSTDAYTDNYDIRDKHYNLLMKILSGSDENE